MSGKGHPIIPVIEYRPSGGPKFISLPDPRTLGILCDEIHVADAYIHAWCSANNLQKAANLFFNPPDAKEGALPAFPVVQADGLAAFFDNLPASAVEACNYGTANVRFALTNMNFATGPGPEHAIVSGQVAAPTKTSGTSAGDSYPVSHTIEGSIFKWRVYGCFQHSLNKGNY